MDTRKPIIFQDPPRIPSGLRGITLYKLLAKEYNERIKNIGSIFLELIATLLVIGVIWISVIWVRVAVTIIAVILALILLVLLARIF